jgi:hypothetical protein
MMRAVKDTHSGHFARPYGLDYAKVTVTYTVYG